MKRVDGVPFDVRTEEFIIGIGTKEQIMFGTAPAQKIMLAQVDIYSPDGKRVIDSQQAYSKLEDTELATVEAITRAVSLTDLPRKKAVVKACI